MVADLQKSIAPLFAPDKPLPAVVMDPLKQSRLRHLDRRQWVGAGLALLIAVSGVVVWRRSSAPGRDISAYTTTVQTGQLDGVITASGEIAAERQVNLSPKQAGQLQELLVQEGDAVRKGQAIARMDPDDIDNKIAETQAGLDSARVRMSRAQREFERRNSLHDAGALSTDDYLSFKAKYETAKADLQAAEQRLQQKLQDRRDLVIRAPFAGVITNRFADPGSYVTPTTAASASAGASSASIVQLASGLEIEAQVPESDIGRIKVGQKAQIRVDAYPERSFAAQVSAISPRAEKNNDVTTFEVTLKLQDPPAGLLRIGMTTDIDFDSGKLPAKPLVPTVSIVTEEGKPGVLVPGSGNEPKFQEVTLGNSSGRQTQVLNGLEPGEKVFIDLPPWASKRPGD